jgi:hypothetical protein
VAWQLDGNVDWPLQMRCDDPNRKRKMVGASFPEGCPSGALGDDHENCTYGPGRVDAWFLNLTRFPGSSRCWRAVGASNGDLSWRKSAIAYSNSAAYISQRVIKIYYMFKSE